MSQEERKEILKELNEAFILLATIPLAGDALDTMAAAKVALRGVAARLKQAKEDTQ